MRLEDLDWHDQRVLKQVVEDHRVEDVDCAVVTTATHQRVLGCKVDIPDGLVVIFQVLVWFRSHIGIEPHNLSVVGTQDEIVATWMDRD